MRVLCPLRSIAWGSSLVLLVAIITFVSQIPSGASTANNSSAPGVTPHSIKVGLITSLTGSDARIDLQNAQGGVYGRKIEYIVEDDQSSPGQAQTAAAAEVTKGVFAIDYNSPFAFGAAQYLQQQGVPVVGGGYDGPEWTSTNYRNMFSTVPAVFANPPRYKTNTTLLKKAGARRFAVIGYGISPSSSQAAANAAISLKQAGFQVPYLNTSLPFGTVNVTAVALQMKAANVDSMA